MSSVNSDSPKKQVLHIDEMRRYAVRDAKQLTPGENVLLIRIPTLDTSGISTSGNELNPESVSLAFLKLVEIREASFAELHPRSPSIREEERNLAIFLEDENGVQSYRYAVDYGVIPRADGVSYAPTNFLVTMATLEATGQELNFNPTDNYTRELYRFNKIVRELQQSYNTPLRQRGRYEWL